MISITFAGNNHNELLAQVYQFMQQSIGQAPAVPAILNTVNAPAQNVIPFPVTAVPAPTITPTVQQAPPAVVPTTVPDYTHEQLGRAVASWIDKSPDNRNKALALLSAQGVQGVTQLDTSAKRGTFATALRAQGVQV